MSQQYKCDQCASEVWDINHSVGWYSVEKEGIDVSGLADLPWATKHFCGVVCLGQWAMNQIVHTSSRAK